MLIYYQLGNRFTCRVLNGRGVPVRYFYSGDRKNLKNPNLLIYWLTWLTRRVQNWLEWFCQGLIWNVCSVSNKWSGCDYRLGTNVMILVFSWRWCMKICMQERVETAFGLVMLRSVLTVSFSFMPRRAVGYDRYWTIHSPSATSRFFSARTKSRLVINAHKVLFQSNGWFAFHCNDISQPTNKKK